MAYHKFFDPEKWLRVNEENKRIMEDYLLEYTARKMKESTIKQYRNDLRIILIYILEQCRNKNILVLTKKDFRNLVLWLSQELELSNARVNRIVSCCRSFLAYLEEDDDYDYNTNQAAKVKGLERNEVKEIIFIEDDIIMKLYDKLLNEERYKEATLLALAYESGGRKGELAQVKKDYITEDRNSTNTVIGKRGKKFQLIYFNLTKKAAKLYLKQRGPDNIENLFITYDKRKARKEVLYDWVVNWRKDLKTITGKDYQINVHSLRHSCLQNMSNGTHHTCRENNLGAIPLEKLKSIANHNDISTTAGYLKDNSKTELEELFNIKIEE